jgi:hypothetical protein
VLGATQGPSHCEAFFDQCSGGGVVALGVGDDAEILEC